MRAKILVQSSTIGTYVNVMAALCTKYPLVNEVMFSFIDKEPNEGFIRSIQSKLLELSESSNTNLNYIQASKVGLKEEKLTSIDLEVVKGWNIVDVTAVSKEIAINISAASIGNPNIHICHLGWKEKPKNWIIKDDNYFYDNLMDSGALSNLYKDYFHKGKVVQSFSVFIFVMTTIAIIKMIWPNFMIPDDIIGIFSLLIGASGLFLASKSIRCNHV
jgi:hypothetical protein